MTRLRKSTTDRTGQDWLVLPQVTRLSNRESNKTTPGRACQRCGHPMSRYADKICFRCLSHYREKMEKWPTPPT